MTIRELKTFFKDHFVPEKLYNLKGGSHTNRICIGKSDSNDGWDVYFSEKKNKIGLMHFFTENDACQYMKEEVCKVMEQVYGMSWRGFA